MALFIMSGAIGTPSCKNEGEWHVGEEIPNMKSAVMSFQADGDELILIRKAMESTRPLVVCEWSFSSNDFNHRECHIRTSECRNPIRVKIR
jgi:hypothetical protein